MITIHTKDHVFSNTTDAINYASTLDGPVTIHIDSDIYEEENIIFTYVKQYMCRHYHKKRHKVPKWKRQ